RASASELEHFQQPYYAKFLTVTNHFPYFTDDQNFPFPKLNSGNSIVDDYDRTAHYLDLSLELFFHYLLSTSLYNHS
ncbi:LTA synthase family protein, partial [Enterococcus faecalis]